MPVKNKVFMFTGRIRVPRHEAQDIVESLGGIAGSYLSHQTDYLVVGEASGDKLRRGQEYGTTILTEDEFWSMVESEKVSGHACADQVEEILISREELENPTDETWLKIKELGITLIPGELFSHLVKVYPPHLKVSHTPRGIPAEKCSYGNPNLLSTLLRQNPEVELTLGPHECPHCSAAIPYTTDPANWYCFSCGLYSRGTQHACTNFQIEETGVEEIFSRKCELCKNVGLFTSEELVEKEANRRDCNFQHSLEYRMAILTDHAAMQAANPVTVKNYETFNPEVHTEILEAWVNRQNLKSDRKAAKRQERYERRLIERSPKPI